MGADDHRTATVGDVAEVRRAVDAYAEKDSVDHTQMRTEARQDRAALGDEVKTLRTDVSSLRGDVTALAIDSTKQNGKLDTLIARTASRDLKDGKEADTKALAVVAKTDFSRNMIRVAFGGFFTILGIVLHHFFG